ncbi:hypothetical protein BH10PSE2_BH10PSE2_06240 [soil metagenome]
MAVNLAASRGFRAVEGLLLAFPIALFTTGLATDIAYLKTAEVQWTNFSSWMITGALVFGGFAAALGLFSLVLGLRGPDRNARAAYFGTLVLMWVLGLVNAFKHSQDGWSSVGGVGLTLSILCSLLALIAGILAFSGLTAREIVR